jgi:hypothetical protein
VVLFSSIRPERVVHAARALEAEGTHDLDRFARLVATDLQRSLR